ncbi:MAG: thioesterase family protein [bacterium]
MTDGAFEMIFEVRWGDLDPNQHMRNTAYPEFANHLRHTFFAKRGFSFARLEKMGVGPVIFSENLQYLREVRLGQRLAMDLQVAGLAPDFSRWRYRHDAWRLGEEDGVDTERILAAVITLEGSWFDLRERRVVPPPKDALGLLDGLPRTKDYEELPPIRRRD